MENCSGKKYSTYILELVRNNGLTDQRSERDEKSENIANSFLLFDYFDVLCCRKLIGKEKKYVNYLSIVNVFEGEIENNLDFKVAYKTLSLYCKSGDDQSNSSSEDSDFFSIQSRGNTLSETPFLGIIQISLCRKNYIVDNPETIANIDINAFLEDCEKRILEIVDECKPVDDEIKMRRVLFRSSTTGDFCLAIRTNLIKLIYDIAIKLNGTQNDPCEKYSMLTFTNVGTECKYVEGIGYATLGADVVRKNSERIALRFSADESIREELKNYIYNNNATVEGLFGRYEYLLTIGMEEFASLYPFLCEKKLERRGGNRVNKGLETILGNTFVRNINERILIELDSGVMNDAAIIADELKAAKEQRKREEKKFEEDEVFTLNRKLFGHIKKVDEYKNLFQEEHFAFQDLIRGMIEIYKSFSPAGMDKESYINWRVFHRDMDVLCNCIQEMVGNYEKWTNDGTRKESDKKWYRKTILGDWRENLNAINRYTTLVQNVNYQTYQSPNYEIQTQIDAEKEMVAYREAMELYITDAKETLSAEGKEETDAKIYPLIYPDLSKEKVTVTAPFMVKRPDAEMTAREIICTVPSFEYFARLYDLLPWIIHETSHHLRVINRGTRNRFVMHYILSYVFKMTMSKFLRRLSDYDLYQAHYGKSEKYLVACMTKAAEEKIGKQEDFENYNFEMLMLEIEKWLNDMFPLGVGYDMAADLNEEEHLREYVFKFWLDAYRQEELLTQDNLELILRVWDNTIKVAEKEELDTILLDKYYSNLVDRLHGKDPELKICLGDIYKEELLEEKLAKLAKVKEERVAVREYYEQIITLYRIMKIPLGDKCTKDEKIDTYLKEVYERFKEKYKKKVLRNNGIIDAASMHMMRNLGLLRADSGTFVEEMVKVFRNVENFHIKEHLEIRKRIYLETYADILMATSLQFNAFGYCRQVLQTASDAKLAEREYGYEDINYERWRTVAAVLLAKPEEYQKLEEENREEEPEEKLLEIDAEQLIKDAQKYCEYVIIHISKKLSESDKLKLEGEDREINETRRQSLRKLLKKINTQMKLYLSKCEDQIDKVLLLDILLHGEEGVTNKDVRQEWNQYKEVAGLCEDVKYNFWRLACFCKGIVNIVKDGKIIISEKLFFHMREIRRKAYDEEKKNCKWERENVFLTDPKHDVGEFYNDPSQVCEKTPDKKLENTIDFIQNYYYFNRFRVVNTYDSESEKA